jgi:hypothetical protein
MRVLVKVAPLMCALIALCIVPSVTTASTLTDVKGDGVGGLDIARVATKVIGSKVRIDIVFYAPVKNRQFRNKKRKAFGAAMYSPWVQPHPGVFLLGVSHGKIRAGVSGTLKGNHDMTFYVRRPGPKVLRLVFPHAWIGNIAHPKFDGVVGIGGRAGCPSLGTDSSRWKRSCTDFTDGVDPPENTDPGGPGDGPRCQPGQVSTPDDPCS